MPSDHRSSRHGIESVGINSSARRRGVRVEVAKKFIDSDSGDKVDIAWYKVMLDLFAGKYYFRSCYTTCIDTAKQMHLFGTSVLNVPEDGTRR